MNVIGKAGRLAAVLAAATMMIPAAGMAQSAPASWATKDGRWSNWKEGSFPTSAAHYAALKAAAKGGVKHTVNDIPDWSGIWTAARQPGWGTPTYVNAPGTPVREGPAFPGQAAPPPGAPSSRPCLPGLPPRRVRRALPPTLGFPAFPISPIPPMPPSSPASCIVPVQCRW